MNNVAVWTMLREALESGLRATLLLVVESMGSSPGRMGFKMAVVEDGRMAGSIGGGIMEHKLVELALDRMRKGEAVAEIRRQVHSKDAPANQSGMICSGEQSILIRALDASELAVLRSIEAAEITHTPMFLRISEGYIEAIESKGMLPGWRGGTEAWEYVEELGKRKRAFVFGGGHVGVCMCQMLHLLGYHITNIDDRPQLNTMAENPWADEKIVLPYEQIGRIAGLDREAVVVLVTFGYRTDEVCLRQLAGKDFAYLGMMGSQAKVDTMMAALHQDGFDPAWLAQVHAPAGLPISSKTPMEIAVSIMAEIVAIQNKPHH